MKHPLKRYTEDQEVSFEVIDKLSPRIQSITKQQRAPKGYGPTLIIENGTDKPRFVRGFEFKVSHDRTISIPEPDLSVIYFHVAYYKWKYLQNHRLALLTKLSESTVKEDVNLLLYDWFGNAASCLITLWLSLETSVNRQIKPDSRYLRHGKEDNALIGEDIIVRLDTKEKLRYALPQVLGRDYRDHQGHQFDIVMNVKDLRDKFTHPKPRKGQSMHSYLYVEALKFPYAKAFDAVKGFINFYEGRDLITDCTCTNPA